jgi:hypothetical protein
MANYKIVWTPAKKEAAIAKITKYLEEHGPGECICQDDNAIIEAPEVMAEIADLILIEGEGLVWQED